MLPLPLTASRFLISLNNPPTSEKRARAYCQVSNPSAAADQPGLSGHPALRSGIPQQALADNAMRLTILPSLPTGGPP
jgi:hypothetical protein